MNKQESKDNLNDVMIEIGIDLLVKKCLLKLVKGSGTVVTGEQINREIEAEFLKIARKKAKEFFEEFNKKVEDSNE